MNIEQIHQALEEGKVVNWQNSLYELEYVPCESENPSGKLSFKGGKAIRVTCTQNYFGSLITESCLENCYIKS